MRGLLKNRFYNTSNISRTTLRRLYDKWLSLGCPSPYYQLETRGRNTALTESQERQLSILLDDHIDNDRILQVADVKAMAVNMYELQMDHLLRS